MAESEFVKRITKSLKAAEKLIKSADKLILETRANAGELARLLKELKESGHDEKKD